MAQLPNTLAAQARLLPIAYGRVKALAYLIEMSPPTSRQPGKWDLQHYSVGVVLASDGGAWKCVKNIGGGALTAPTGQGADPAAWAALTNTPTGAIRQNGGNVYQVVVGGVTAASGGPSGTGTAIKDGNATWMYLGATPFPIVDTGEGYLWRYLQQLPYPTYRQFFLAALCEGEIVGAVSVFVDKERYAAYGPTDMGSIALLKGVDTVDQVPQLGDSAGYQHTALLQPTDATPNAGIPTGTQKEVPALAVEIDGVFGATGPDVNPADILNDLLTHTRRGCGWPSGRVDATTVTGSGGSSYRTYCDCAGFRFSMYIDSQRSALSLLADILNATNSDAIWSQGALKIVPLGDQAITGTDRAYGSVDYTPPNTAQYNLSETDFLEPIQIQRGPDADCFNDFPIEFIDRSLVYQTNTVEDPDQTDIDSRGGYWRAGTLSLPLVFPDGKYPISLSRIYAQRSLNVRNEYTFRLPWRYLLLEPTDIVTLSDATMGLSLLPVRIVSMREESDFTWTVTAEDYPEGVAASGAYTPQGGDGYKPNQAGTEASGIPSVFGTGAMTSPSGDNLFPNGTSENSPTAGYAVANDGNSAEWDYRLNVGAGNAKDGSWVRAITGPGYLGYLIPTIQDEIIQLSCWAKNVSGNAPDLRLIYYDTAGGVVATVTPFGDETMITGPFTRVAVGAGAWGWTFLGARTPAGAVRVGAYINKNTGGVGVNYYDSIILKRMQPSAQPGGRYFVDGNLPAAALDLAQFDHFESIISAFTPGLTATIGPASNMLRGQRITVSTKNTSGGAVTFAFDASFHLAGAVVQPANGKKRIYDFEYDGSAWHEIGRSSADVTN